MKEKAMNIYNELKAIIDKEIGNEAWRKADAVLEKHGFKHDYANEDEEMSLYDSYYKLGTDDGVITICLSASYRAESDEPDADYIFSNTFIDLVTVTDEDGNEENLI